MTPLLWIQYGRTAFDFVQLASSETLASESSSSSSKAATELRLQTLELGLQEFPGSSLLQIHYCEQLINADHVGLEQKEMALSRAIDSVGRGSHRNEGAWVAMLYAMQAEGYSREQSDRVGDSFVQRSKCPMKDVNDSIAADYQNLCARKSLPVDTETLQQMEHGRLVASKVFRQFEVLEDDIDAAMRGEGILARDTIVSSVDGTYLTNGASSSSSRGIKGSQMGTVALLPRQPLPSTRWLYRSLWGSESKNTKRKKRVTEDEDDVDPDQAKLEDMFPFLALAVTNGVWPNVLPWRPFGCPIFDVFMISYKTKICRDGTY